MMTQTPPGLVRAIEARQAAQTSGETSVLRQLGRGERQPRRSAG